MKIRQKILSFFATLLLLLSLIHLLFNLSSKNKYSPEDTIQFLKILFVGNTFTSVIIIIILIPLIYFVEKIIEYLLLWLRKNNIISKIIRRYDTYYKAGDYEKILLKSNPKFPLRIFKNYLYSINKIIAEIYLLQGQEKLCKERISFAVKYANTDENQLELLGIKFQLFINSGNINGAKELLDRMKQKLSPSNSQTILQYESLIYEKEGFLE